MNYNVIVTRKEVYMDKRKFGSNIHILDDTQIKEFEERYDVQIQGDYLIFSLTYQDYNRAYPIGKKFNAMIKDKTKMTIQPMAVDYWKEHQNYSLFKIQNTINKLIIFNQDLNDDAIAKLLEEK